jgi:hypothetical protein
MDVPNQDHYSLFSVEILSVDSSSFCNDKLMIELKTADGKNINDALKSQAIKNVQPQEVMTESSISNEGKGK